MKFSKELSARADLRFLKEYISYKELKKAIKVITGSDVHVCTVRDVVSNFNQTDALTGSMFRPPESRFQDLLNHELEKVNSFSRGKIFEILGDLDDIHEGLSYLHNALLLFQGWLDKNALSSPSSSEGGQAVSPLSSEEKKEKYEEIQKYIFLASRVVAEASGSSYYKEGEQRKEADEQDDDGEKKKKEENDFSRGRRDEEDQREKNLYEVRSEVRGGTDEKEEEDLKTETRQSREDMKRNKKKNNDTRGRKGGEKREDEQGGEKYSFDYDDEEEQQDLLLNIASQLLELENLLDFQGREVIFLDSFVRLNFTGFRKITKKYDKHHKSSAAGWYMSRVVRQDFMNLNFSLLLSHLANEFAFLSTLKNLLSHLQQHTFFPLSSDLETGSGGGAEQGGVEGVNKKDHHRGSNVDGDGHGDEKEKEEGVNEVDASVQDKKGKGRKAGDGALFYSPIGGGSEWGGEEKETGSSEGDPFICRKYLVPPDELMKIKVFVAKHLSLTVAGGVHVTSPSTSQEDRRSFIAQTSLLSAEEKEKEREKKKKTAVVLGGGKIPTWEVYLENDEFFFYISTRPWITPALLSEKEEESGRSESSMKPRIPRVRWQGQAALASSSRLVVLELSHPDEASWDLQEDVIFHPSPLTRGSAGSSTSPSSLTPPSPFSTVISQKHLQSLLQGRFASLEAFLSEVLNSEYAMSSLSFQGNQQSRVTSSAVVADHSSGVDGVAKKGEEKEKNEKQAEEEKKRKRKDNMRGVLTAVWEAVQNRKVKPCVRTWFYRTQYRNEDGTVYINVDEDVRFSRELNRSLPATQWLRSETEALTADDVQAFPWGILNISYPSSSSSSSFSSLLQLHRYPSLSQEDLPALPPSSPSASFSFSSRKTFDDLLSEMIGLSTVTEVRGFSLFAHGVGCMYTAKLRRLEQRSLEQSSLQASGLESADAEGKRKEDRLQKRADKELVTSPSSSRGLLLPPWLAYTSSGAMYDEDSEEEGRGRGEDKEREETEQGKDRMSSDGKNKTSHHGTRREMSERGEGTGGEGEGRKQESRGRRGGGEMNDDGMMLRGYRGSAVDVVHKGTSASLVHELQSRAHECPPSVTTSEFDHHHHHPAGGASSGGPPCCQSRRSSGLYTSTPLLLSTSSPGPLHPSSSSILEGSALYRPPNTARTLLRQPLLGEGMRQEEEQGAGRGREPSSSSLFSRPSHRSVSWYTACFRPSWCRRLCGAGLFSSPPLREENHTSSSTPTRGDVEGNSPNSRRRGTAGGRCRRLATCLFPWNKRRSARRLIHPSYSSTSPQAGNLVGPGSGGATVRVEPKTFFANERTLLQWMNTAVLIATLSITLMNFGDPIGRLAGLVMAPVAVFFIAYSFWVYLRRARALERKEPINYNDKLGPSILVLTLVCSLTGVILLNVLYPDEKHPGHTLPPSNIDQDTKTSISPSSALSQSVTDSSSSSPSSPSFSIASYSPSLSSYPGTTSSKVSFSSSSSEPSSVVSPPIPESVTSAALASIAALQAASAAVSSFTQNEAHSQELSKFVNFSSSANLHAKAAYAYAEAARAAALVAKQVAGEGEKKKKKADTRHQEFAGTGVDSHKKNSERRGERRRGKEEEVDEKDRHRHEKTRREEEMTKEERDREKTDEHSKEDDPREMHEEKKKNKHLLQKRTGESGKRGQIDTGRKAEEFEESDSSSSSGKEESSDVYEHHKDSRHHVSHSSPHRKEKKTRASPSGLKSAEKKKALHTGRGEQHYFTSDHSRLHTSAGKQQREEHGDQSQDKKKRENENHSEERRDPQSSSMWSGLINGNEDTHNKEIEHAVDREI